VREYWQPDMMKVFRDAGLPRREPPRAADCGPDRIGDEDAAPSILSPLRGVTYALRTSKPVALALNANTAPGRQYWFADSGFIGEAPAGQALAWMPPSAGHYRLRVVDNQGRADSREVTVEAVP
jgi:penicillin-binding protein 1C